ncbi:MAG: SDR family oxidoreductase [Betaproteobacteria bacterium]|nr:MAG: SDR family oxidoreductase [Betaproteobacteria bacterium]
MSLEKKTVLVTGGGRGLGAAICKELARAGASLVVADINPANAQAVAEGLRGGARALKLDVTNDAEVAAALQGIERLDVLVNNAAVDFTVPIDELTMALWDAVISVNLRGPFLMAKHAARRMKAQGGGQIVNIASTAAKRTWPNASAYHASKWGLLGLSHALHAELRPHRIKVSAVVAGGMRTPFLLDRFPDIDPNVLQDPANVAATIRFLLTLPEETVIPEVMVIPMRESSWP